jgi:hypothetical protein
LTRPEQTRRDVVDGFDFVKVGASINLSESAPVLHSIHGMMTTYPTWVEEVVVLSVLPSPDHGIGFAQT